MPESADDARYAIADAFDRDLDPLMEYASTFEEVDENPFTVFKQAILVPRGLQQKTLDDYDRVFTEWRDHMTEQGRHPACPNEDHVMAFIRRELDEKGHVTATVKRKLAALNAAYEFWQDDAGFPHPQDYNPFESAVQKVSFPDAEEKDYPRIDLEDLRDRVNSVKHHRDRAILALQIKCGLRAGELCNLKLADVNITDSDLRDHYPALGTHEMIVDRENAIYIAAGQERKGNKSDRPRVLPLDDELRRIILRYLLVRPAVEEPWLLLSKRRFRQLDIGDVNRVWTNTFHPEYEETDRHKAVTSHYGRHWFTTFWKVHQGINAELVHYMRGDEAGTSIEEGAMHHYIHTYYEDIEKIYRECIFKLDV